MKLFITDIDDTLSVGEVVADEVREDKKDFTFVFCRSD